jgi:hypothetical protein
MPPPGQGGYELDLLLSRERAHAGLVAEEVEEQSAR